MDWYEKLSRAAQMGETLEPMSWPERHAVWVQLVKAGHAQHVNYLIRRIPIDYPGSEEQRLKRAAAKAAAQRKAGYWDEN